MHTVLAIMSSQQSCFINQSRPTKEELNFYMDCVGTQMSLSKLTVCVSYRHKIVVPFLSSSSSISGRLGSAWSESVSHAAISASAAALWRAMI